MAKVQQKHLEGLIFRTNEEREVPDADGMKRKKYHLVERPLTVEDVISQQDNGESFRIVTADGRKYDVPKTPAKGGKDDAE